MRVIFRGMRPTPLALAVAALSACLGLAPGALAQQTYTSVAGPWWFTIGGKDRGSILLQLTSPSGGTFAVEDLTLTDPQQPSPSFGFSRSLASFFLIESGQGLGFDADGNVVGELALTDPNDTSSVVGTLSLLSGRPNRVFTTLRLRASIDGVVVKLVGVRPPSTFPVLAGATTTGILRGKKLKSNAMDLEVADFEDLGPPSYAWSAAGPVSGEPSSVALAGHLMLAPGFRAWGLLEDSDTFSLGTAGGGLALLDPNSTVPTLALTVQTVPTLKLKGLLIEATEPVLSVTPSSFDFGSVALGTTSEHTFAVSNAGAGLLSGSAQLLTTSSIDFSLSGNTDYTDLAPGDAPSQVQVSFAPETAGTETAQLRFGVSSGVGAQVITVTGCGGVAAISVSPSSTITFPDTQVGTSATPVTVTVTNPGDCTLTGQASLTTGTVFTLVPLDSLVAQSSISYTVAAGASTQFRILFTPTDSSAAADDTLVLTGGGGATVDVTGAGTP